MRSGSVKHFPSRSRGTSKTRDITKSSAIFSSTFICNRARLLRLDDDHPVHAELVGRHSEARRKKRFAERHHYVSTGGERVEEPVGIGFVFRVERQGKTP